MLQIFTKKYKGFTLIEHERSKSGGRDESFTLIELLVVIAVIGMLASIVLVSLGPVRKKGRDARRMSDIRQINLAMEMCYDDVACNDVEKYIDTTAGPATGDIGTYLTIPPDPLNSGDQVYKWTDGTDQYYCGYVKLEAENAWFCASNKGVMKSATGASTPTNANCCGVNVTS